MILQDRIKYILIQTKIEEIEATFDLVLITEKFPESVVLLKDLLCWESLF